MTATTEPRGTSWGSEPLLTVMLVGVVTMMGVAVAATSASDPSVMLSASKNSRQ